MNEKDISLDPEAQQLFAQFGGLETWKQQQAGTMGSDRLAQSLLEEQKRRDAFRILMIQLTYLISRYLAFDSFTHKDVNESKTFQKLSAVMSKLSQMPGSLECAFIRYRGAPTDDELPDKYDYEIVMGNTEVDTSTTMQVVRRNGQHLAKLPDQLIQAFTVFAEYGVNNIFVRLPSHLSAQLPSIQLCLKILSGFREARKTGTPIIVKAGQLEQKVPVINDENLFPDPNLTLMAGINRFSQHSMEKLVQKIDVWLRHQQSDSALNKYGGVYNAALELPKIRSKVQKPLVEMNNIKWLIIETEDETVSVEKVQIAKLASDSAGASPQKVAKMLHSVYGNDFAKINAALLGERLHLSSDLLNTIETRTKEIHLGKEVLGNIQNRLDQVKDHIIDDVHVREATREEREKGEPLSPDVVHNQLFQMVSFFKGRSKIHQKMIGIVHRPIEFSAQDYQILAKDFCISMDDAQVLVQKLKECFSQDGSFKKSAFFDALDVFRQYEEKIFEFLWHHMKDAILSQDRVPFLNALQSLTAEMNQPKRAFKILLEDICGDPERVQFSDNKAVMLANLMLYRYDKNLADFEITPEDIVLSHHKLDENVVGYAAWRIEKEQEPFFKKVQTIHRLLAEALHLGQTSDLHIPAPILLNLERELFIFLTLVACDTGKAILRSATSEYGNPQAEIYHFEKSTEHMALLLQNLRVSLRGVGHIGTMQDVVMLEEIKQQEENFRQLKKDRQHRSQVRLITEWVDEAVKVIKFRS